MNFFLSICIIALFFQFYVNARPTDHIDDDPEQGLLKTTINIYVNL